MSRGSRVAPTTGEFSSNSIFSAHSELHLMDLAPWVEKLFYEIDYETHLHIDATYQIPISQGLGYSQFSALGKGADAWGEVLLLLPL